jgi:integrase
MSIYKQKGSEVWWMSFSFKGRQIRKSTGAKNKKFAEEIYCKTKSQYLDGTALEIANSTARTFEELIKRYLDEVTPGKKPGTQRDDRRYAQNWFDYFGDCLLNEITSDLITKYVQKRKSEVGPSSINRELSFLSAAFSKAIRLWGWHKENPVSCVPREKEKKRVEYFSNEEFSEIYGQLADWVKPIVIFGKNTGLRLSNLANLRWNQVNLAAKAVYLDAEEMKNSKSLGIPLNEQALDVLLNQQKVGRLQSVYVFSKANGKPYTHWGISSAFKKACIKAGCSNYRFHDLRHDFCSKLVQSGVDIYTVKELAGHKDITTTQRYSHLSPERLRKAVDVLDYHSSIIVDKKRA